MSVEYALRSALGLFVAYFGFGMVISLLILPLGRFSALEFGLISFSLSVGCLTLLMLLLGLLKILTIYSVSFSILAIIILLTCFQLSRRRERGGQVIGFKFSQYRIRTRLRLGQPGEIKREFAKFPRQPFHITTIANPIVLAVAAAIATLLFLSFYHSLVFPQILSDSLTEYAFLGKRIYLEGGIPTFSGSSGSVEWSGNYPMLVPMLYAWFNFSSGSVNDLLSRSIYPVFGIATLAATFAMAKRLFNRTAAIFSIYMLAVTPIFLAHLTLGYVDVVLTYYFVTALYFLFIALEGNDEKQALLAGLSGGLAAWTKYQGLLLFFIILVYWLIRRFKDRTVDKVFFVALTAFVVSASPWYIRNWLILGNPVYPHLHVIFGGRNLDEWLLSQNHEYWVTRWSVLLGTDRSLESLVRLPIALLVRDNSIFSLGQDGAGLLLACFAIPGMLLSLKKRTKGDQLLVDWVLIFFLFWFTYLYYFIRYLMPLIPALAIMAGRLLDGIILEGGAAKALQKKLLLVATVAPLFTAFFIPAGAMALIGPVHTFKDYVFSRPFSFPSTEEALQHAIPADYALWQFINNVTPPDAVILTFDHRWYYVDRALAFADGTSMKELYFIYDISQAVKFLLKHRVTYIVVEPWYKEIPLWYKSILYRSLGNTTYFQKVFDEWGYAVYRVKGAQP